MDNSAQNKANIAIMFILIGMLCISVNDMFIKSLSGGYPLHEIVFIRSFLGILVSLIFVHLEGGLQILKTKRPIIHAFRGILIVVANMTFFLALAAIPLADATALFFAAPLFITLLSIPILGEKVGPLRLGAIVFGFIGVLIMQRPWEGTESLGTSRLVLLLPVIAGFTYALNQILTRKLGVNSKASALSVYIQMAFIVVSLGFYIIAGDGAYSHDLENPSLEFLLRAWIWPHASDYYVFIFLGCNGALIGYCLSQAYRMANAATVASFEYVGLPYAVVLGWWFFDDLPVWEVWLGMAMIISAGLFVWFRERQKAKL